MDLIDKHMNARVVTKKIKSVTNVKKITKAMQMVSAVKMRRAQQIAIEGKPYQEFLRQAIERLASGISTKDSVLLNESTTSKRNLVIVFTAQKIRRIFIFHKHSILSP